MNKKYLEIVKDLSSKYPKGPNGKFTKNAYYICEVWSTTHNRYRQTPMLRDHSNPLHRTYGYKPETLFSIFNSPVSVRDYVEEAFKDENLSRVSITRRANSVLETVRTAAEHVKRQGAPGVYSVIWGYGQHDRMYMYGNSVYEVGSEASVYNGMFNKDITETPRVVYVSEGTRQDAHNLNMQKFKTIIDYHEDRSKRAKEAYEESKSALVEIRERVSSLEAMISLEEANTDV